MLLCSFLRKHVGHTLRWASPFVTPIKFQACFLLNLLGAMSAKGITRFYQFSQAKWPWKASGTISGCCLHWLIIQHYKKEVSLHSCLTKEGFLNTYSPSLGPCSESETTHFLQTPTGLVNTNWKHLRTSSVIVNTLSKTGSPGVWSCDNSAVLEEFTLTAAAIDSKVEICKGRWHSSRKSLKKAKIVSHHPRRYLSNAWNFLLWDWFVDITTVVEAKLGFFQQSKEMGRNCLIRQLPTTIGKLLLSLAFTTQDQEVTSIPLTGFIKKASKNARILFRLYATETPREQTKHDSRWSINKMAAPLAQRMPNRLANTVQHNHRNQCYCASLLLYLKEMDSASSAGVAVYILVCVSANCKNSETF